MSKSRRKVWLPPSDVEVLEDFNDFLLGKYKKIRNEVTYSEFTLSVLLALAAWGQYGGSDATHLLKELEKVDEHKQLRPLDDNATKFHESFNFLKDLLRSKQYLFRNMVFAIGEFDEMIEFGVAEIMHWLSERTYQAFDYWLEEYRRAGKGRDFIQPSFITQLTLAILEKGKELKGLRIFNPFAGSGSFLTTLGKYNEFYAQELEEDSFHLMQLRLCCHDVPINKKMALGRDGNPTLYWISEADDQSLLGKVLRVNPFWSGEFQTSMSSINLEDSLTTEIPKGRFDLLLSAVPALSRSKGPFDLKKGLLNLLSAVRPGGTIALVVPTSHLFSSGYKGFRQFLVERGWLRTIVTFPRVINGNRSKTSLSLLIIVKRRSAKCRFVDLTLSNELNNVEVRASVSTVVKNIFRNNEDTSVNVDYSKIDKEKFILVPKRYIFLSSFKDGVPLGKYVEISTSSVVKRLSDLRNERACLVVSNEDRESFYFTSPGSVKEQFSFGDFKGYHRFQKVDYNINQLILRTENIFNAFDLNFLDPYYDEYPKDVAVPIWVPLSYKILKPRDESRVHLPYLKNALNHDFAKQIPYLSYTARLKLTKQDLLLLRISLPSLESQRELSSFPGTPFLLSKNRKEEELQEKVERLENQKFSSAFSELSSLTHSMSKDIMSLILGLDKLRTFFGNETENILTVIEEYNSRYRRGLRENIAGMNSSLQSISNMLEDLRNRKSVSDYALADIDCDLVINKVNNVCQAFTSKSFTQVDIEANSAVDIDTLVSEHAIGRKVSGINLDLFERLIKNVLSNADTHAFQGVQLSKEDRVVKIELEIDEAFFTMSIMNNGIPFPANFRKREFILENMSANMNRVSGRGGYDIHQWSTYMQGEDSWELELNDEDPFPVIYNFKYKLI